MKAKRSTTAEKPNMAQTEKQRAFAAGRKSQVWSREQGVELSRLVLGFARCSKRLPDAGDLPFWQLCLKRFNGMFTCKQVQAKARYLHLRFRKLATGAAKTLRLEERHSVRIWTHIIRYISPSNYPDDRSTSSARSRSLSASRSYKDSGATQAAADGYRKGVFRGYAKGKCGMGSATPGKYANMENASCGKSTGMGRCASKSGGAPTAVGEAEREASACSFTQVLHEEMGGFAQNDEDMDADEGVGAAPGNTAADQGDRADTAHKKAVLLHHVTVADLAAAVKILAEIVARGPAA